MNYFGTIHLENYALFLKALLSFERQSLDQVAEDDTWLAAKRQPDDGDGVVGAVSQRRRKKSNGARRRSGPAASTQTPARTELYARLKDACLSFLTQWQQREEDGETVADDDAPPILATVHDGARDGVIVLPIYDLATGEDLLPYLQELLSSLALPLCLTDMGVLTLTPDGLAALRRDASTEEEDDEEEEILFGFADPSLPDAAPVPRDAGLMAAWEEAFEVYEAATVQGHIPMDDEAKDMWVGADGTVDAQAYLKRSYYKVGPLRPFPHHPVLISVVVAPVQISFRLDHGSSPRALLCLHRGRAMGHEILLRGGL